MPSHARLVSPTRNITQKLSPKSRLDQTSSMNGLLLYVCVCFLVLKMVSNFYPLTCFLLKSQLRLAGTAWLKKPRWLKGINLEKIEVTSQKTSTNPHKLAMLWAFPNLLHNWSMKSQTHLSYRRILIRVKLCGVWTLSPRKLKNNISAVANAFGIVICIELGVIFQS